MIKPIIKQIKTNPKELLPEFLLILCVIQVVIAIVLINIIHN